MDDSFQGSYWKDPFVNHLLEKLGGNMTWRNVCDMWGLAIPDKDVPKSYAAMFATSWPVIRRVSVDQWRLVRDFVTAPHDGHTAKDKACIVEYMWSTLMMQPTRDVLHDDVISRWARALPVNPLKTIR